jgi:hypothetical protein
MITLHTVIVKSNIECLKVLLESVTLNSTKINEIVVSDICPQIQSEETAKKLSFQFNGTVHVSSVTVNDESKEDGHALGLIEGLKVETSNAYKLFCDPDIFFIKKGLDSYLVDLYSNNDLMFLGAEHHNWHLHAFDRFPTVILMLVASDKLPKSDFMKGKIRYSQRRLTDKVVKNTQFQDGQWMLAGPVKEMICHFPHQERKRAYDVGCNLFLWNKFNKGRWMSFGVTNKIYDNTVTSNFDYKGSNYKESLFYHQRRCCTDENEIKEFHLKWNEYLKNLDCGQHK